MTRTVKACITFLLLLLVAASVFAVLYSQGVLDALLPNDAGTDTPGGNTDTPGGNTDTPGGNMDKPGTDTPGDGTEQPAPGEDDPDNVIIITTQDYVRTDGVYLIKPYDTYVFDIANITTEGEDIDGELTLDPDPNDPYFLNFNGEIQVGTYQEVVTSGEVVHTLWKDIKNISLDEWTDVGSYGSKMLEGVALMDGKIVIQTGMALEDLFVDQITENWGSFTYTKHYYKTITQCYIRIQVRDENYSRGYFDILVTNDGQEPIAEEQPEEPEAPEEPAEDPIISLRAALDAPVVDGIYQLEAYKSYEIKLSGETEGGNIVDVNIDNYQTSAHGKIKVGTHEYTRDNGAITNEKWTNVHEIYFSTISDRSEGGYVSSGNKLIVSAGYSHKGYVESVFTENWGFYRGTNEYYGEVSEAAQKPYIRLTIYGADGKSVNIKYIVV